MTYSSIHNSFREQNTGSTIEIRMSSSIDLISGSNLLSNLSGYHQTTNRITESVLIVNINHDALPDVANPFWSDYHEINQPNYMGNVSEKFLSRSTL